MKYVYLLRCKGDNTFYIGTTHDIQTRVREHADGMHAETKDRRPVDLVYYESYDSEGIADSRAAELNGHGSHYQNLMARLRYK